MTKHYKAYLSSYEYKTLLEKYDLDQEGIWLVRGEDPNCDLGGYHYQPTLGYYRGRLEDIVKIAVELKNFWTWGAGGNISLVKVIDITDVKAIEELRKEKSQLELHLKEINENLQKLGAA